MVACACGGGYPCLLYNEQQENRHILFNSLLWDIGKDYLFSKGFSIVFLWQCRCRHRVLPVNQVSVHKRPQLWWQHATKAVLLEVQRVCGTKRSCLNVASRGKHRRRYIDLYLRYKRKGAKW